MKFFFMMSLVPFISFAQVSQVEIKNFNFNYNDPSGEGEAEVFNYQMKEMPSGAQRVQVLKKEDGFHFSLAGVETREFVINNLPDVVQRASEVNLSGFNLNFKENAQLNFTNAHFLSPDNDLNLRNFSLDCSRNNSSSNLVHNLIIGCVERLVLKAGGFNSSKQSYSETNFLDPIEAIVNGVDERNEVLGGISIKNVELKVIAGKFNLAAEIKAQISGKAIGKGTIQFDQATSVLTAKVSEIKFGILDVTSQVFDELKKQQTEKFKVKQPYIYISIK